MTRRPYRRRGNRPALVERALLPAMLIASEVGDTLLWLQWQRARHSAHRHMRDLDRIRDEHRRRTP